MFRIEKISSAQFDLFRSVIGFYSAILLGLLLFDRVLYYVFGVVFVGACILGVLSGIFFALNFHRRIAAIVYLFCLAYVVEANPSALRVIPGYVGWVFLMTLFVKPLEGCRIRAVPATVDWPIDRYVQWAIVIVLAFSFSFSGLTKLLSPMWRQGEALEFFSNNPRFNWSLNPVFSGLVNSSLADYLTVLVELVFFPAYIFRPTRRLAWFAIFGLFFVVFLFMRIYVVALGVMVVLMILYPRRQRMTYDE